MKQLEHALKRVALIDAYGVRHALTELQFVVARAVAERTKNPDSGVQLAIAEIQKGCLKSRSSVTSALSQLVAAGLIHRARGGPHDTHIFRFSQILIDGSTKSRPWDGPAILLQHNPPKNANICSSKPSQSRMNTAHLVNSDTQYLDTQNLGGNYRCHTPPAPRGGDGVDEKNGLESLDLSPDFFGQDFFNKSGAVQFFDWLNSNGVDRIYLDGMPRKKDGQRGAGVAQYLGFKYPIKTEVAVDVLVKFGARLVKAKKMRVDLQMRGAECPQGLSKLILVDDLSMDGVAKLKAVCAAPGALLETSKNNFQAILVCKNPLGRMARLHLQRHLCELVGGDRGALSSTQLHRFPGSPNFKNQEVFVARLVEYFVGTGPDFDWAGLATLDQSKAMVDNSRLAMSWTMSELRKGTPHAEILIELGGRWLKGHCKVDWPARTLRKALIYLGNSSKEGHAGFSRH